MDESAAVGEILSLIHILQDEVYASVIGVIFHFGIETNQFANNEKHVLIM